MPSSTCSNSMPALWSKTVAILRGETASRDTLARLSVPALLGIIAVCGAVYGLAMGSYNAIGPPRLLQALCSAAKVPMLIVLTFALSLPSFFILNTVLGLRDDFRLALRVLLSSQAGQMAILASLTPYVLLWNASCPVHEWTILFNALMFGIATFGGQLILRRSYAALIAQDPRHLVLLRIWVTTYAFVGIQLAWTLRPFVGDPRTTTAFLRADSLTNAYVALFEIVRRALRL
jgi:hypothetical protein